MQRSLRYIKALVTGKRFRSLFAESWEMGWPLICVMLFEFLVSITDVYIAGRFGKEVQGAVGFVSQIYFIFVVLANAITMGTVSVVSKLSGSGNCEKFSDAVWTVIVSVCVSGTMLAGVGWLLAPAGISATNIPSEIKAVAVPFVKIYFAGLIFHYILINTNGLLRAVKRAKRSLVTMGIIAALNIALNFFFLYYTDLSFRGIAIATVISYFIGAVLNIPPILSMLESTRHFSRDILSRVIAIGWPSLVLQISWQLGSVVMFLILGALPENRTETIAAFTNGLRIESAIFLPAYALNMSAAAIAGNLLGEKRQRDAYFSGAVTAALGAGVIILLSAAVILNARTLSSLLSPNPLVVSESIRYLIIQMAAEPFMAVLVILSGALNGAGDTRGVMMIVTGSLWLVRIPCAYIFAVVLGFGPAAVWIAMDIDIFVRLFLTVRRYRRRRWIENA
ncbi:MAG: MATE family efflux transporter [Spirochaetota bacterium]